MDNIIQFVPGQELATEENLRGFVQLCREQLTVFGSDLSFDDNIWDVTHTLALRVSARARLLFHTWGTAPGLAWRPLREPFLSFAKAYIRYQHAFRPTKSPGYRLTALRALEMALSEAGGPPQPTLVNSQTLNRAVQLCADRLASEPAYQVGRQLECMNDFMIDHRLLAVPARWRSPLRPNDPRRNIRVGAEFDHRRQAKLPSPAALSAVAHIFRSAPKNPIDVLVSSIVAILCSAPDRISEVLYLEEDCEVTRTIPSTGQEPYGLRWRPAKGAEPMVKWIIPSMTDVVKEAIQNIRRLTEPARKVARWYELHPTALFLPPHLEPLRKRARITLEEVGEIVFAEPTGWNTPYVWCRRNNVNITERTCLYRDIEAIVLRSLPDGFPWAHRPTGLTYSRALCLLRRHEVRECRATLRSSFGLLTHAQIAASLGGRKSGAPQSIFDRHGFTEDDGRRIHLKTHQFRHYLNTLAQAGGLSQLDVAKWSGRRDVRQNPVYDHQSDRDVIALVRSAVGDRTRTVGPLATARPTGLISRDEFSRLKVPTAHTTEFGYCIHDFTMLPCQIHRNCLNCMEHVCIKGDTTQVAHIRRQRTETEELLRHALAADSAGDAGANRWVVHQQQSLARLNQLCAIFDDPQVPVGTVIQPAGEAAPTSHLERSNPRRILRKL